MRPRCSKSWPSNCLHAYWPRSVRQCPADGVSWIGWLLEDSLASDSGGISVSDGQIYRNSCFEKTRLGALSIAPCFPAHRLLNSRTETQRRTWMTLNLAKIMGRSMQTGPGVPWADTKDCCGGSGQLVLSCLLKCICLSHLGPLSRKQSCHVGKSKYHMPSEE